MIFEKNNNVLNIFCDASIKNSARYNTTIGCSGAISVENSKDGIVKDSKYILTYNSTNNLAELKAIELAVSMIPYGKTYDAVNIFSDSLISVKALREWCFVWMSTIQEGILYSSSGSPVANQDIILNIINKILLKDTRINLFHQKGHVNNNIGSSIAESVKVFYSSNDVLRNVISRQDIRTASEFNNRVDKETRDILINLEETGVYDNSKDIKISLVQYMPDPINLCKIMSHYSALINRGGVYNSNNFSKLYKV